MFIYFLKCIKLKIHWFCCLQEGAGKSFLVKPPLSSMMTGLLDFPSISNNTSSKITIESLFPNDCFIWLCEAYCEMVWLSWRCCNVSILQNRNGVLFPLFSSPTHFFGFVFLLGNKAGWLFCAQRAVRGGFDHRSMELSSPAHFGSSHWCYCSRWAKLSPVLKTWK